MPLDNPYQSPEALTDDEGRYLAHLLPGARATLVAQGLLYRRIAIEAPVEATLEFNGRSLNDTVLVNNRVVARKTSWWRIAPRLEFTLPVGAEHVAGCVEIRVGPLLSIRGFRVTIGDQQVYQEGRFKRATINA